MNEINDSLDFKFDPKKFLMVFIENGIYQSGNFSPEHIPVAFLCLDQVIVDPTYRGSASMAILKLAKRYPEEALKHKSLVKKAKESFPRKNDYAYLDALWIRWCMDHDTSAVDEVIRIAQTTRDNQMAVLALRAIERGSGKDRALSIYLTERFGRQAIRGSKDVIQLGKPKPEIL